jgi:pectate lyase
VLPQIYNFYAEDYGKVYRSCGTVSAPLEPPPSPAAQEEASSDSTNSLHPLTQCEMCQRNVYVEGVSAYGGGEVAGINLATGDTASLVNVCTDAETPCQYYDGPGDKAGAC